MPQLKHKKIIVLLAPVGLIIGMAISAQGFAAAHGGIKPYAQDASGSVVKALSGCVLTRGGLKKMLAECGDVIDGDVDGDGVKDSKDMCPGTPKGAPVDAKGCPLDSDGDGIPDYLDKCPGTAPGTKVDRHGCEIMAKKPPVVQKVVIGNVMLFGFDSAELKMEATDVLDDVYAKFKGNSAVKAVVITGHADSMGSDAYNMGLSERRAESVRDYLIGSGANGSLLTARGVGESKPTASNDTAEGRSANRRVEFTAIMR